MKEEGELCRPAAVLTFARSSANCCRLPCSDKRELRRFLFSSSSAEFSCCSRDTADWVSPAEACRSSRCFFSCTTFKSNVFKEKSNINKQLLNNNSLHKQDIKNNIWTRPLWGMETVSQKNSWNNQKAVVPPTVKAGWWADRLSEIKTQGELRHSAEFSL